MCDSTHGWILATRHSGAGCERASHPARSSPLFDEAFGAPRGPGFRPLGDPVARSLPNGTTPQGSFPTNPTSQGSFPTNPTPQVIFLFRASSTWTSATFNRTSPEPEGLTVAERT
ncbi:hypothetical protein GCM10028793_26590 [Nocardiopsis oceani]